MYSSTPKILFTLYLQWTQILNIFAYYYEDLEKLMGDRESAQWPLQAGYPGLAIKNLNEYVSLFSHCLVNIQNYQGIEIIGIQSPVYITRFDVANFQIIYKDFNGWRTYNQTSRFFFGRIPQMSKRNRTKIYYYEAIKYTDKSFKARWYCTAQFDLFYPEPLEAPHIVYQSQLSGIAYSNRPPVDRNIFDIAPEYIVNLKAHREDWSKLFYTIKDYSFRKLSFKSKIILQAS